MNKSRATQPMTHDRSRDIPVAQHGVCLSYHVMDPAMSIYNSHSYPLLCAQLCLPHAPSRMAIWRVPARIGSEANLGLLGANMGFFPYVMRANVHSHCIVSMQIIY